VNARGTRRPRTSKVRGPRVKVAKGGGGEAGGCGLLLAVPLAAVVAFLLFLTR
jgi:hypothetical protein